MQTPSPGTVTDSPLEVVNGQMPGQESASDERLLEATPGNTGAFSVFYRRYEPIMLAYFVRRTRDAEVAADLTAETFAAALQGSVRFRAGGAPAGAWLFGIARHKLARSVRRGRVEDLARRRLGMTRLIVEDEDLTRIEQLGRSEEAVMALLDRLPVEQSEAVRAHVLDERPYQEIAAELRCSEAVVRKRVSRALSTLRARVNPDK
jgi:RNA polymerase sigma factor (sigma-70 family)